MQLKKTINEVKSWLEANHWIESVHIMDDEALNALTARTYMEAQIELRALTIQEYTRVVELQITIQDYTGTSIDYMDFEVLDAQTKSSEILADLSKYLDESFGFWRNNFPRIIPFKDKSNDRTSGATMLVSVILPEEC